MRQHLRRILTVALLAGAGLASGCVSKGDVNVEGGPAEGELPTCANVCGLVTSNDVNWCGCGAYVPKDDRELCISQCEELAPPEDALRCSADAVNCDELADCGTFWPASQVATGQICD